MDYSVSNDFGLDVSHDEWRSTTTQEREATPNNYDIFAVTDAVRSLPTDYRDNYMKWVNVGRVLYNTDSDALFPLYDQWSQGSSKYLPGDTHNLWAGFARGHCDNPLGLGSLFKWAKEAKQSEPEQFSDDEPWFLPFGEFAKLHKEPRPPVIENVVYKGDTMNVIAPTKLGKSFFIAQTALSVISGQDWFGHATTQGPVLIIDNELHGDTLTNRINQMRVAMKIKEDIVSANLTIASLRGNLVPLDRLCERIKRLPKGKFSLIILDALYRMAPEGNDENGNGAVTDIYNLVDSAATAHGCAFAVVHHASKGDQSKKSVTDVGSGAGAQSRAVDCHLVLRPHAALGCVTMQAAVRACPEMKAAVLRREFPLWIVDDNADALQLRNGETNFTLDDFAEWLEPGEYVVNDLRAKLRIEQKLTVKASNALIKEAMDFGLLVKVPVGSREPGRVIKTDTNTETETDSIAS